MIKNRKTVIGLRKIGNRSNNFVLRDQLVTLGDLDEFKADLFNSIKRLLSETSVQHRRCWLKSYQVKKLLDISTGTLQTLRTNGTLPFALLGGTIYYDPDDIEKELQKRKKTTKQK